MNYRTAAKTAAILLVLSLAPLGWVPVVVRKISALVAVDMPLLAGAYALAAFLGLASIVIVPFLRTWWIRWTLSVIFLLAFAADYVAHSIQGEHLSSYMLATFIQAIEEVDHAFGTYGFRFGLGALLFLLLLLPFGVRPPHRLGLGPRALVIPAAALSLTFILIGNFTGRLEELPSPIAVPVQAYFATRQSALYLGPRNQVAYKGLVTPRASKVLLIVDEGVRGDYLQINNPRFDNTPFLQSALPVLANFGVAVSYSNCSATARVALRSGARDTDFPDPAQRILRQPTIWQYARKAGFRTVYIDAWLPIRRMSSMLTYDELSYVDERTAVPLEPYWDADDRVADQIVQEVDRPGPSFMFVEKIGLHSPYARNIPPDPHYSPAYVPPHADSDARMRDVRDYTVGINWRVDRFFSRLLPRIEQPGVLLIYTSDHGQALYEAGYEATNCSGPGAARGEGLVPLFLYASDPSVRTEFQSYADASRGRAAHSDIFPTILWALGFDVGDVLGYSDGLRGIPQRTTRRFFVFSPFNADMRWVNVN